MPTAMKKTVFIDIDTQHDFMGKNSPFYVKDSEEILPNLKSLTEFASSKELPVFSSFDNISREKSWKESKMPQTLIENSKFIQDKKLHDLDALKNHLSMVFEKREHSVFSNPNFIDSLENVRKAFVYGVATDFCVHEAVSGLIDSGIETFVVKDAVKPMSESYGKGQVERMQRKGAKFITTSDLLNSNL